MLGYRRKKSRRAWGSRDLGTFLEREEETLDKRLLRLSSLWADNLGIGVKTFPDVCNSWSQRPGDENGGKATAAIQHHAR